MVSNIYQKTSLDTPDRAIILDSKNKQSVRILTNATAVLGAMLLFSSGIQLTLDVSDYRNETASKQIFASTDSLNPIIQKLIEDSIPIDTSISALSMMLFPSPVEFSAEEAINHKRAIETFFN